MENLDATGDIFKKSFLALSEVSTGIGPVEVILNMAAAILAGLFIQFVYRKCYQGVLYQRSFAMTIVMVAAITCLIIMTIRGNLVLSLGLVGALSIVRFRTPIKDTMDLAFLFWAISAGVAAAVSFYALVALGCITIAGILYVMTRSHPADNSYILVIKTAGDTLMEDLMDPVMELVERWEVKSEYAKSDGKEFIIETRAKSSVDADRDILPKLKDINGVNNVSLVSFRTDLMNV